MRDKSINRSTSLKSLTLLLTFTVLVAAEAVAQSSFSNTNGVVTDSKTNLQWQDDYQDNNNEIKMTSYTNAQTYCAELSLSEQNDWRLPTREELLSIVDTNRDYKPAADVAFESITDDDGYLTTTQYEDDEELVWTVDFTDGDSTDVALIFSDGYFVRCVRDI